MAGSVMFEGVEHATHSFIGKRVPLIGTVLGPAANIGIEMATAAPGERAPAIAGATAMSATGFGLARIGVGGFLGLGIEAAAYFAVKHGLLALDEATKKSNERFRSATRVGFSVADTFGNESRMLLTQRQQSIRAMHTSILNARSSIGNEAAMTRKQIDEYLP